MAKKLSDCNERTPVKFKLTSKNLSFIICAAGSPNKSNLSVGICTLLQHQISEILLAFPKVDITVILGFEFDKIYETIRGSARVIENENFSCSTSAHSVNVGLRASKTDHVYIIHGDILFKKEAFQITEKENHTFLLDSLAGNSKIGIISQDGITRNLSYGLEARWGQMLFLNKEGIELYQEIYKEKKVIKPFLFEMINDLTEFVKVKCVPVENKLLLEVNTNKDLV